MRLHEVSFSFHFLFFWFRFATPTVKLPLSFPRADVVQEMLWVSLIKPFSVLSENSTAQEAEQAASCLKDTKSEAAGFCILGTLGWKEQKKGSLI